MSCRSAGSVFRFDSVENHSKFSEVRNGPKTFHACLPWVYKRMKKIGTIWKMSKKTSIWTGPSLLPERRALREVIFWPSSERPQILRQGRHGHRRTPCQISSCSEHTLMSRHVRGVCFGFRAGKIIENSQRFEMARNLTCLLAMSVQTFHTITNCTLLFLLS